MRPRRWRATWRSVCHEDNKGAPSALPSGSPNERRHMHQMKRERGEACDCRAWPGALCEPEIGIVVAQLE
ncbi:hypothetical protein NDU88_001386 [Pleurodeles waltl]|uniref:Uncharacterized protein n=1 Tax=Pleurodeles waltl TaxID=8319 RepID=A0AAV7KQU6_PLEWA|nr:hypothetical protein NDU88_001386 [Pleurodeles waltl]